MNFGITNQNKNGFELFRNFLTVEEDLDTE